MPMGISTGLEKTPESPSDSKEIQPVNLKGNKPWISLEELILTLNLQYFDHLMWTADSLKIPWCWEGLRAEGEKGIRESDGWMASLTQWTWTWANYKRCWETSRPGMLQSMRLQRVGHNWVTKHSTAQGAKLGVQHFRSVQFSHSVVQLCAVLNWVKRKRVQFILRLCPKLCRFVQIAYSHWAYFLIFKMKGMC